MYSFCIDIVRLVSKRHTFCDINICSTLKFSNLLCEGKTHNGLKITDKKSNLFIKKDELNKTG